MNCKRNRALIGFFIICLGLMSVTSAFPEVRGVSKDAIKLGMILVKTGPVAALGLPDGWGIQDVIEAINSGGGIAGRKIDFSWEDDQWKTPLAISAFNKLIYRDKVLGIVTIAGTAQNIALMDQINKDKVATIPNAMADEFYEPYKPFLFVLGATYETQVQLMVDYIMNDLKAKDPKIGVVYAETEFGKKGLEAARKRAQQYGLKLVSELVLNTGAVDASSQVLSLKKDHVDYVVTCNLAPSTITFLKTAEKYDYRPTTFGVNWACDNAVVKACGIAAKNYIGVNFVGGWTDDTPGMKRVRELAKKNGRDPDKMLSSLYVHGVAMATVYAEGLKRAGKDLTPDSFKNALETLKDFDTGGIVPPVTFTSTSHAPSPLSRLYRADPDKGAMIPITDWRKPVELK